MRLLVVKLRGVLEQKTDTDRDRNKTQNLRFNDYSLAMACEKKMFEVETDRSAGRVGRLKSHGVFYIHEG